MFLRLSVLVAVLAFLVAGCGGAADERQSSNATVEVVATTMHLADMARAVGGDRVAVTTLLPANADPHDHEVRPGDIRALSSADLVLRSGGDLDEWLTEAIESAGSEAPVLNLIEHVRTIGSGGHAHAEDKEAAAGGEEPHADEEATGAGGEEPHAEGDELHGEDGGEVDPHWWQDPGNGRLAVAEIREALVAADPEGRAVYTRRADAYLGRLRELESAIADCLRRVPDDQRKLVTTHGSFGYYADRFDVEVIGTVLPSLSTQGQPSAGETRELVETIERENVRAIFTERAVNPKVERAIAEETGARIGTPLWADSLGPADSDGATYLDALAANTRALVDGFTGGALECRLPA